MRNYTELLSAQAGTFIVNNTTLVERTFHAIMVLEDTVFEVITDGVGNDRTDYIATPSTAVRAGAFITPLDRVNPFSSVKLTSGSIAIVL